MSRHSARRSYTARRRRRGAPLALGVRAYSAFIFALGRGACPTAAVERCLEALDAGVPLRPPLLRAALGALLHNHCYTAAARVVSAMHLFHDPSDADGLRKSFHSLQVAAAASHKQPEWRSAAVRALPQKARHQLAAQAQHVANHCNAAASLALQQQEQQLIAGLQRPGSSRQVADARALAAGQGQAAHRLEQFAADLLLGYDNQASRAACVADVLSTLPWQALQAHACQAEVYAALQQAVLDVQHDLRTTRDSPR